MAIITTSARLNFGSFSPRQAQIFNNISFNQTTSSGGLAFPFIAEKTMTVTDIGAVVSGVTTTQGVALDIGIQTDNAGVPSGTFLTTGSITLPANTWSTAAQFAASSGNSLLNTTSTHYLKVGDVIRFANTTGGVAINTDYFIVSTPAANQMTISTSSTLTPVFSFTATVTPGTNTFTYSNMSYSHCSGITASITQGTAYWLVYQWTGTGTGQIFFNAGDTGGASGQSVIYGLGYATRSAGTWTKATTTRGIPVMYTDGTNWYGNPNMSGGRVASTTLNNNDRFGFRFSIPTGHPDILLDRVTLPTHPGASPGTGSNWKAQLFTDNGAGTPTFVSDLSSIAGDTMGNATSSNFASTIFQTPTTTWLSGGSSYIIMCGFDVSPASGNPTVNYFSTGVLTPGRSGILGPYDGGWIYNFQSLSQWFTVNPDAYAPWTITAGGMRYNDTGSGGGGFANASSGFGGIGGN
ncbi:hypothetical protein UFOVP210_10 [uncultured Caudovirales phage]|uniref:Uncharacterized protein n=1 Tax=uncultured Caudovirales phage TaxID=2100421 RepID=A0A6J7WJ48_9CAUD|nr:hypothetical protein UFOVP210_10 [uncultured Caudovirales phage]